MHDIFISYSSKNKNIADAVVSILEMRRIKCWIAPRDEDPGEDYADCIVRAIENCKACVFIFSSASNRSKHVLNEINLCFDNGKTIIPFRIDDVSMQRSLQYYIGKTHWLDALTGPLEEHINKLADTLDNLLKNGAAGHTNINGNNIIGEKTADTEIELKPEIKNVDILKNYLEYSQVKHIEALEAQGKMEIHHAADRQSFTAVISDVNKEKCLRQGFFMALIDFLPCENWGGYAKNNYTLEFEISGIGLKAVQLEVKNTGYSKIIDKEILITAEKQKVTCKLRGDVKVWEDVKEICFVVFANDEYMLDVGADGQFTVENLCIKLK